MTPTAEPGPTATREPEQESPALAVDATAPAEPDRDISAQTLPLLELLPTQDQVPAGLLLVDEAERSKEEVITALGGTEEAAQLLDDWGWSGNAFRDFIADEDAPPPSGTTFLNVSVHRFADPESAANAMVFFSDQVIFVQGLEEVEPPAIGESARLLTRCARRRSAHRSLRSGGTDHVPRRRIDGKPRRRPYGRCPRRCRRDHRGPGRRRLIMLNRENAIGLVLLLLCGVVALVLIVSIVTGTRFRFEGPSWVGTVLVILFFAGTIYGFLIRPGRRWSWPWSKDKDQDRLDGP